MQQTIFLDVAQTYYQVLNAERSVLVLTNSVKVQDANVADIVDREHAGVARPLDVAQAQAQDSSTRADLITARENVKNTRTMLAYLIDAPCRVPFWSIVWTFPSSPCQWNQRWQRLATPARMCLP